MTKMRKKTVGARRLELTLLLTLGLSAAACGGEDSAARTLTGPSPTSGSGTGAGSNPGSGTISGIVFDTAIRPLAGALVEAIDGPRAGTSTTSDAAGEFSFPGSFDFATRFQASKEGHITAIKTVDSGTVRRLGFYLEVSMPSVNMAGDYTLTISADMACTDLPTEARTRTFTAAVASHRSSPTTYFDILLVGASLFDRYDRSERSVVAVAGQYVAIWIGGSQPGLVERLSSDTYVAIGGKASMSTSVSAPSFVTAFDGFIDYCVMKSAEEIPIVGYDYGCDAERAAAHVRCQSPAHRLTMMPR
jgi:hypothetical protein